MSISSVNTSALSGMQNGLADMQRQSQRVANGEEPVAGLIGVRQAARQVEANARVVKVQDDTLGRLIDERA
ncbi:MAG: hypothetical protein R6X06_06360 [Gammaproteobacteria bacterium]